MGFVLISFQIREVFCNDKKNLVNMLLFIDDRLF